MDTQGFTALAKELRGPPPPGLRQLSSVQLADLAAAVREARQRQAQELARAGDQALRFIPRILRGPVRRVIR